MQIRCMGNVYNFTSQTNKIVQYWKFCSALLVRSIQMKRQTLTFA